MTSRSAAASVRMPGRAASADAAALPPVWPHGLTEGSPLPFALWQVLHLVDGRRSAGEIAALTGVTPQEVTAAVTQAGVWVGRALLRAQRVTPAQRQAVVDCLMPVLGPVAEFVVEDTLEDLGEEAVVGTLLSGLAAQLTPPQAQLFAQHLRVRNLA